MRMNIPAPKASYHTYYKDLKGVDFSKDRTEVSEKRSPDCLNMISDNGGNPVKRVGWREVVDCGSKVLDIIFANESFYVITSSKILKFSEDWVRYEDFSIVHSSTNPKGVVFEGKVYFFLGSKVIYVDNSDVVHTICDLGVQYATGEAYVPRTVISRTPDGKDGTMLEEVNILTPMQKNDFLGNETDKTFVLTSEKILYGAEHIKVEAMNAEGKFVELTYGADYTLGASETVTGKGLNGAEYSFTICDGKVTFGEAKPPVVTGQDNIRITFCAFDNTEYSEGKKTGLYRQREGLTNPYALIAYGYSATDRVFIASSVERNKIFYSEVENLAYFPDLNYLTIGNITSDIVGFARVGGSLGVVKEETSTDSTIFLVNGTTFENITSFKSTPTKAGTGGLAPLTFATLGDEPLFLSRTGVYGISNYYVSSEYIVRNRSYFIDRKLTKEPNLDRACAISWNRYYLVAVNGHCYVLDGRNKANDKNNNTDFLYEAYYWENIPAVSWANIRGDLYFGTETGKICRFNTDIEGITAYCDNGTLMQNTEGRKYLEGGIVIPCRWTTPLDDDKYPQYFKTLSKKGTLLTLMPYDRSSVKVTLIKDGTVDSVLDVKSYDIFNFSLIDFSRFTFNSVDTAQDDHFKKKVKKYVRLQFVLENNGLHEPFGILGLTKTYTIGNYSK